MTDIQVIRDDAIEWMRSQKSETFDLVVSDPPYNVGKDYGNNKDSKATADYNMFTLEWLREAVRLLKPNGSIYCFMGFRHISELYRVMEDELGLNFVNWICWHYTQGLGKRKGFSARHDDVLLFSKSKDYTFNLDAIRIPQKFYRSINNMRGANPGDVWEFSHIHYCQKNRQKHPTQKPEGLIERMVRASSNEGDIVLDPFLGSGTTARVCQQLGRKCVGIETNPDYVEMANTRLSHSFEGFDSIDPRMHRVPRDLRDPDMRSEYVENHIKWFLDKHPDDIELFRQEVANMYGEKRARKPRSKVAEDMPLLDMASTRT